MSKTQNKNHSEVEHLRGQVKKLKAENRNLKKRLKEFERWEHVYQDAMLESEEIEVIADRIDKCPKCDIGELNYFNFVHTELLKCNKCDYRERIDGKKEKLKESGNTKASRSKQVVASQKRSQRARKRKNTNRNVQKRKPEV